MLVVESAEHAERRGAPVVAEIGGGALTGDAFHISAPDPSAYSSGRAMEKALRDADVAPEQVQTGGGPRHQHAAERRQRDEGDPLRLRRPRRHAGGDQQQEHDRPHPRRGRRHERALGGARHPRRPGAADHQLRRRPTRTATWTTCRTPRARRRSTWRSSTASASAARTRWPCSAATRARREPTRRAGSPVTYSSGSKRGPRPGSDATQSRSADSAVVKASSSHGISSGPKSRTSVVSTPGSGLAAHHRGLVDQRHHADVRSRVGADQPADLDPQLRLFLGLAPRPFLRRLADLQEAARIGPQAGARLDRAASQEDAPGAHRQRADHQPRVAPGDVAVRAHEPRTVVVLEQLRADRRAAGRAERRLLAERQGRAVGCVALRHRPMVVMAQCAPA